MAQLRDATAADAPTIRKMVIDERLDPTSLDWRNFMLAEQDGQIVGIAQVKPLPGCNEFGSLIVKPTYRGQGIGAQLLAALEARAGFPLYLTCYIKMEPYYERFGFRRIPILSAPASLRLKLMAAQLLLLAGRKVIGMVKE